MDTKKCVVVGDKAAEKTWILVTYTRGEYPSEYVPTMFDNCIINILIDGKSHHLDLYDASGCEEYERTLLALYHQTDVFIVCFSVVDPVSFVNVKERWAPEIKLHCPKTPFIIVGTQTDLRENPDRLASLVERKQIPITFEDGEKLARKLKAFKYVECSALTQEGVKNVFDQALAAVIEPSRSGKCNIQ